jgi:hypothetical protein
MSLMKLKDGREIELEEFINSKLTFDDIDHDDEDSIQTIEILFETLFDALKCHYTGNIGMFGKIDVKKAINTVLQKRGPETEEIWKSFMIKNNGFDIFTIIPQLIDGLETDNLIFLSDYLSYLYFKRKTVDIFFISDVDFQEIQKKFKTTLHLFIVSNKKKFLFESDIERYNKIPKSIVSLFKSFSKEDFRKAFLDFATKNDSSCESSDRISNSTTAIKTEHSGNSIEGLKPFPDIEGLPTNSNFNLLAGFGSIISPDTEVVHSSSASVAQVYAERRSGKEKED